MDYEKKYNEMVRRAKELYESGNALTRQQMEIVCPELTESEDERIRKELLAVINNLVLPKEQRARFNAYLKKQKELFKFGRGLYYYDGEKTIYCGYPVTEENPYDFAMSQQEKRKEQKKPDDFYCKENCQGYKETGMCYFEGDCEAKRKYDSEKKEQKPAECGASNDGSEYDRGYREGHKFGLMQTQEYMLPGGRTFSGLIPCWVNAPSTLQPAHKYHGKNVVIMHENNGGYRCCCIDDEKATTFHLPENTLFVEGWRRKKPAEWSEEEKLTNQKQTRI